MFMALSPVPPLPACLTAALTMLCLAALNLLALPDLLVDES
jgi:hypothetical protein